MALAEDMAGWEKLRGSIDVIKAAADSARAAKGAPAAMRSLVNVGCDMYMQARPSPPAAAAGACETSTVRQIFSSKMVYGCGREGERVAGGGGGDVKLRVCRLQDSPCVRLPVCRASLCVWVWVCLCEVWVDGWVGGWVGGWACVRTCVCVFECASAGVCVRELECVCACVFVCV